MAVIGVIGGLLGNYFLEYEYDFSLFTFRLPDLSFYSSSYLGALFNQLTLYITYWRRNFLHKKGNRVKVLYC